MNKAIFLDRDGVLNIDSGYTYKTEDLRFFPDVFEALNLLKNEFLFFIVTNQSGINKGYYTEIDFIRFNSVLVNVLKKKGIIIEKTFCCPHTREEKCDCAKPNIKFAQDASEEFYVDLRKSYVIGDHPHDIEFGINAGCKSIYIMTGHGEKHLKDLKAKPDFVADNLLEAAKWILNDGH
jgi:D-glycero-D-manno-heptose 1,7-bisphosphate phosphatase